MFLLFTPTNGMRIFLKQLHSFSVFKYITRICRGENTAKTEILLFSKAESSFTCLPPVQRTTDIKIVLALQVTFYSRFLYDVTAAMLEPLNKETGGHIGVPTKSSGNLTLLLCKSFLLFWLKNMAVDHVSENQIKVLRKGISG